MILMINIIVLESEIDADCSKVALLEGVIGESSEERGLSDRAISYDDDLK